MAALSIKVVFPWWTNAYINTVVWFCLTFGTEPDVEKVARFIARRARFKAA